MRHGVFGERVDHRAAGRHGRIDSPRPARRGRRGARRRPPLRKVQRHRWPRTTVSMYSLEPAEPPPPGRFRAIWCLGYQTVWRMHEFGSRGARRPAHRQVPRRPQRPGARGHDHPRPASCPARPRTTCCRVLQDEGFLLHSPETQSYGLGPLISDIGSSVLGANTLARFAAAAARTPGRRDADARGRPPRRAQPLRRGLRLQGLGQRAPPRSSRASACACPPT